MPTATEIDATELRRLLDDIAVPPRVRELGRSLLNDLVHVRADRDRILEQLEAETRDADGVWRIERSELAAFAVDLITATKTRKANTQ